VEKIFAEAASFEQNDIDLNTSSPPALYSLQAHNVEKVFAEAASFALSAIDVAGAATPLTPPLALQAHNVEKVFAEAASFERSAIVAGAHRPYRSSPYTLQAHHVEEGFVDAHPHPSLRYRHTTWRKDLPKLHCLNSVRLTAPAPIHSPLLYGSQAHNVEKVFAEAASFELSAIDFAGAAREIEFTMRRAEDSELPADGDAAAADVEGGAAAGAGEWLQLKATILDLEARVGELPLATPGKGGDARYAAEGHAMKQLLALVNITAETLEPLLAMMNNAIKALSDAARWGAGGSAHYLRKLSDCLRVVFSEDLDPSEFRVCVTEDKPEGGGGRQDGRRPALLLGEPRARTLGYVCQNPGVGMRALVRRGVRSVLLTSGTLSPLSSFALELGIPFAHQLENPHVVTAKQIMVGVLPKV
jgi:hypothetical protein